MVELSGEAEDSEAQAELDTILAFMSLGGDDTMEGCVDAEKLKKVRMCVGGGTQGCGPREGSE